MQHIVFGAGLIGGYLYGALREQRQSVAMVARASVQAKLANGLTISDYQHHQACLPEPEFVVAAQAKPCRYLWLTLKCTAVPEALEQLRPFVDADTVIFCCQNGLGCDQLLRQGFPRNRVVTVIVMFNVSELTPGHLHRGSEGNLYIEVEANTGSLAELAAQLDSPLLPVETCVDMPPLQWAKLQVNLANAVNALSDLPVRAMMEQRGFRRCIALLMQELLAVVAAKGIRLKKMTLLAPQLIPVMMRLPDVLFRPLLNRILSVDPHVRTSMWWDIHEGRRTEVDFLNGAVVAEGRQLGIACPANERIVQMLHELECGERSGAISAAELLRELQV